MRILFAATAPPTRSGKGYQVRLYHQLQELTKRHRVSLITFGPAADQIRPDIAASGGWIRSVPISIRASAWDAIVNSPRLPVSVGLYRNPAMARALADAVRSHEFDLGVLQLIRMAPYPPDDRSLPVVLDLLDSAGLSMAERAALAPPGLRPLLAVEARRLEAFERDAIDRADLSLFISQRDRAHVGMHPKTRVNPNGIDPPNLSDEGGPRGGSTVTFTGTMSFPPNADAAVWFARKVLPLVRRDVPDVTLRIVGRDPGRAVRELADAGRIVVTGAVESIGAELSRSAVAVCPMRYGAGLQTKILEAMATGTPVVCTSKAAEGLPGTLASHVIVADGPERFAQSVVSVLRNPQTSLERAARGIVAIRKSHTWRHSIDELEHYYAEAIDLHARARRRT